jgi:hypothetical protein
MDEELTRPEYTVYFKVTYPIANTTPRNIRQDDRWLTHLPTGINMQWLKKPSLEVETGINTRPLM